MTRIEIDVDGETELAFALMLFEVNASARASGQEVWTPSELAASLLRQLLEEDAAAEVRSAPH